MTSSTPASERRRATALALLAVALLYAAVATAYDRLAGWAESEAGGYPYRSEDWLRYLLPHMFDRFAEAAEAGAPRILVGGPSGIREDVLPGPIESALPGARVLQGGLSLGTLDDVLVSLELIEASFGARALPDVIVLGLTPRFVASIPDERPFLPSIDRYHSRLRVEAGPDGPVLVPKSAAAGALSWLSFHVLKQSDRTRTALLAAAGAYVGRVRARCGAATECPAGWPLAALESALRIPSLVRFVGLGYFVEYGVDGRLGFATSASKYQDWPARDETWMTRVLAKPDTFWPEVFAWDPAAEEAPVLRRIERLHRFAADRQIALVTVNLPENEFLADRYRPERYAAYEALLARGFGAGATLDLRRFLARDEFLDFEHATAAGAARFTARLIELLSAEGRVDRIPRPGREAP